MEVVRVPRGAVATAAPAMISGVTRFVRRQVAGVILVQEAARQGTLNDSPLNKIQHKFWVTKQKVKKTLKKVSQLSKI